MKDFIEQEIIYAVKKLLTSTVNDYLRKNEFVIPFIEFRGSECGYVVTPVISLSSSEGTEKERIIRQDVFTLIITFNIPENRDSELHCYAYSSALGKAVHDNPTLGCVVDKAVITGKKYLSPKKPHCGEAWELVITLRATVEGMRQI